METKSGSARRRVRGSSGATAALVVNGIKRSCVMSSSETMGEARPDDSQFCDFPGRKAGSGRPSAILGSSGGLRDRAALSKATNSGKVASEPGPIRRIPDGTGNPLWKIANTDYVGSRRRQHPANVGRDEDLRRALGWRSFENRKG